MLCMDIIIYIPMGKTTKATKKPKATKPKTKKKEQTGPKKPKSGFMFFSQERRKALKEEQPTLSITEASKVIGAEWRKLTDEEKKPYDELASKDRERYKKEKQDTEDSS